MRKPPFISHYLVLSDLLKNVDVRAKSDAIFYLTSRIENVKMDLVKQGIEFVENTSKESTYSHYKPYILVATAENLTRVQKLIERYATDKVLSFLEQKPSSDIVKRNDTHGLN